MPEITSTQLNDKGPIFRSLSVVLAEPGGVEVEYWSDDIARLAMGSKSSSGTSHEVVLPRLRANANYHYLVRSTLDGRKSRPLASGTFTTADLPADLKAIGFTPTGKPSNPLTFLSVRSTFTGGVIVDADGHVVWYGRTSVAPQGAARSADGGWAIVEDGLAVFSPAGEKIWSLPQTRLPVGSPIHHGVTATPRNTWLMLTLDPRTFGARTLAGEAIWEWDPQADSLTKRWSSFDFLDPTVDFGVRSIPSDWFHANSLAFGPAGNILLSFHFLDQVLSITPDYSAIQWRLGGPGSSYTLTADQATSGQHSAREVAPNSILIFDNGYARVDGGKYSRAIELKLDPNSRMATTVWQYRPSPDIWASIISSVRRLPNGNSALTFGTPAGLVGATGPISVHEVTPHGKLVWKLLISLPSGSIFQGDPLQSIAGETAVAD